MPHFSLSKKERLHSQKKIEELFESSSSFFSYPFKVFFLITPEPAITHCLEVLFSVSKKKIKKSTARNLIKRRMREAFRLHKALFSAAVVVRVAFIYTPTQVMDYKMIEKGIQKALQNLQEKATKNPY